MVMYVSDSLPPHGLQATKLLGPWGFPGKNTEVGSHFLLPGTFLTQGSNLGLPHCGQSLYHLSRQGSPKTCTAAAAAQPLQSCPTLCDPRDGCPPGSPIPGILQARTLEWVAISFSRGSSSPRDRTWVSHIVDRCFTV